MTLLIVFLVLVAVVVALAYVVKPSTSSTLNGITGRPILSEPELAFYHQLCRALPHFRIFPQVAVNAIMAVEKHLPKAKKASLRNRYSQWHVDFVVCELENLEIVSIVEFDGKQHKAADDAWRDKVLAQGGYSVHRFRAKTNYTDEDIASRFGKPASPILEGEQF